MAKETDKNPDPTAPEFVPHWQGKPEDPKGGKYVPAHGGWKLVTTKESKTEE